MRTMTINHAFVALLFCTSTVAEEGRVKGVATPPRRLNAGSDRKPGILRAFDQAWADASIVQTDSLVSRCVKPKGSGGGAASSGKGGSGSRKLNNPFGPNGVATIISTTNTGSGGGGGGGGGASKSGGSGATSASSSSGKGQSKGSSSKGSSDSSKGRGGGSGSNLPLCEEYGGNAPSPSTGAGTGGGGPGVIIVNPPSSSSATGGGGILTNPPAFTPVARPVASPVFVPTTSSGTAPVSGPAVSGGGVGSNPTNMMAPVVTVGNGNTVTGPAAPNTPSGTAPVSGPAVSGGGVVSSPTAVAAPVVTVGNGNTVTGPAAPNSPSGTAPVSGPSVSGGGVGSSPTTPVAAPTMTFPSDAKPLSPTISPKPTTLAPTNPPIFPGVVAQAAVCDAFHSGTAPTTAPRQDYTLALTLNLEEGADEEAVLAELGEILNNEIAPSLIGCTDVQRRMLRRDLQGLTELVNLVFSAPGRDAEATCEASEAGSACVPAEIDSDLFYYGDEPVGFAAKLRQALLFWNFDIDGLLSFGNVKVTQEESGGAEGVDPQELTPTATPANDRDIDPAASGILDGDEEAAKAGGRNVKAAVLSALAAVTVVLLALFVIRRRRNSTDSISKHRELTDDEEDLGFETDENTAASPPRKAYVVGENASAASWGAGGSNEGQEVYAEQSPYDEGPPNGEIPHSPHHECSSPNCYVCEMKRQHGTTFVVADAGSGFEQAAEHLPADAERGYVANDTVDL